MSVKQKDWKVIRFPESLFSAEEENGNKEGFTYMKLEPSSVVMTAAQSEKRREEAAKVKETSPQNDNHTNKESSKKTEPKDKEESKDKRERDSDRKTPKSKTTTSKSSSTPKKLDGKGSGKKESSKKTSSSSSSSSTKEKDSDVVNDQYILKYLEKTEPAPWNDFWSKFTEKAAIKAGIDGGLLTDVTMQQIEEVMRTIMGVRIVSNMTEEKYQLVVDFFKSVCGVKSLKKILSFYKTKINGTNYSYDAKLSWFQGALSTGEEEGVLAAVPAQTFLVTFGSEDNSLVFAYNDYDDESKRQTSTYLIAVTYNEKDDKFTGMDMENPECDDDVLYNSLFEVVNLFKKLGFKPLGNQMILNKK